MAKAKQIEITLKHSTIGRPENQKVIVKTLGLRKLNQTVIHDDNPAIRGMAEKVSHLVEVKELNK
jgi:large subunit ribosomal protein L30